MRFIFLYLIASKYVFAAAVNLAWDPTPPPQDSSQVEATGYRIAYGLASGVYNTEVDVGNVTSGVLPGLLGNTRYYIAVKAYNTPLNLVSAYSNEVTYIDETSPPPQEDILGNDVVGTSLDSGSSNYIDAVKVVTGAAPFVVNSMSVHVGPVSSAPNNQYQVAIYASNSNGNPGALVAQSASGTLTANAWNTIVISAVLQPNSTYWLAYNTNGSSQADNNLHFTPNVGTNAWRQAGQTFGTWPSTFGTASQWAGSFSIFASGNPVATLTIQSPTNLRVGQ